MAGVTHIEIQESVEELEALVRQQNNARLKERLQALYMIKNQGITVCAIASQEIASSRKYYFIVSTTSFPRTKSYRTSLGTS
ncbi:MAG: hypothetical protein ACREPR_17400 [Brasilonema sp.]